jgi:hypothetical protein
MAGGTAAPLAVPFAFVGLSQVRETATFGGLPITYESALTIYLSAEIRQ